MSRYVIAPHAMSPKTPSVQYEWDGPMTPSYTVDGPATIDTGLIDQHGHAIMRVQAPIGFGRDSEH